MSAIGNCPDLDALAALAREATAGEWKVGQPITEGRVTVAYVGTDCGHLTGDGYNFEARYHDAAYIAAANPAVVLGLIEEIRRFRAAVARVRGE